MKKIRVAIIGPTGFTALYLIELLRRHAHAELTYLASRREETTDITEEFPQLLGRVDEDIAICRPIDYKAIAEEADVVFLGLPHQASMEATPELLKVGLRVIDLSADYRISDPAVYEAAYGNPHTDQKNLGHAAYGLPELFRDDIGDDTQLVANPGCYPTAASIGVAPLLRHNLVKPSQIIVNGASGVTGAGRTPKPHLHFPIQNEAFVPYGEIGGHRHQPEMEQIFERVAGQDVPIMFIPHLLPIDRGILTTLYLEPIDDEVDEQDVLDAFQQAYEDEPFVRVRPDLPNVKHVRDTNFCDVTVRLIDSGLGDAGDLDRPRRLVVFSAIDNMYKGASGQAIQNMNLMFEIDETAALL